ncbi:MAG TPA: ion channel [Solirubrobacterales bacterium]|nr:ion channel [Solirubrobacterales bacterium]
MDPSGIRAPGGERWLRRAERFGDAFGLVFALVVVTYVLTSLLSNEGWDSVVVMLAVSATSVVALTSSHVRAHWVHIAFYLSALGLVLAVIASISGDEFWLGLGAIVQVLLLTAAMAAVLVRVITTAEVGARTILGAISVYTVLGLLFAFLFEAIGRIQSGPFFENHGHIHHSDYLFFSYTTLTTTGYGDLVPGGQPGRMFAGLEMLIGQIFLVTLVAGLVAVWRPGTSLRKRRERRAEEASGRPPAGPSEPDALPD